MKNRKSQAEIYGLRKELETLRQERTLKNNIVTEIATISVTENAREIVGEICDKLKVKSTHVKAFSKTE